MANGKATIPRHLDKVARAEWRRMAPLVDVTHKNRAAFGQMCQAYSMSVKAQEAIDEHGVLLKRTTREGESFYQNPAVNILKDALSQYRSYCREFGIMAGTGDDPPKAATDGIDEFLQ